MTRFCGKDIRHHVTTNTTKNASNTTATTTAEKTTTTTTMVFAFDGKRVARVEKTPRREQQRGVFTGKSVFSPGKSFFGGFEDCDDDDDCKEKTTSGAKALGESGRNGRRRRINVKREMKRFMASETKRIVGKDNDDSDDEKAGNTTNEKKKNTPPPPHTNNKNAKTHAADSKFSMKQMRREVRDFGTKGLNKWDRKELEDEKLKALGMKPSKGIRIPATVGVGLWKKNEQRKEEKRLDAFRLGHKLEKKEKMKMTNSEKEQKRDKDSDRGLAWGSSWFKNGILKLKKGDVKKNKVNVDTKVRLSGKNRDAKGKGGKKSKKGAKGSKKRGAGKKSSRR